MDKVIKIIGVESPSKVYIRDEDDKLYTGSSLSNLFFDGESPKKSFSNKWLVIDSIPKKVARKVLMPNINYRYVLVEDAPGKDILPEVMPRDEVTELDEDGACIWKKEFRHLESLYNLIWDEQAPVFEDVDFEYRTIYTVPELNEVEFSYKKYISGARNNNYPVTSSNIIRHNQIDEAIFPEIMRPLLPCHVSSKDLYDIVRFHIKNNIDLSVASITSDYDFCFTVKKKIEKTKPEIIKTEIKKSNGKSYKNRKYRENYITHRLVDIFEMTYSPYNYSGYTPIPPIYADTHLELEDKVNKYLEDILNLINTPLIDCQHCNGMGVVTK